MTDQNIAGDDFVANLAGHKPDTPEQLAARQHALVLSHEELSAVIDYLNHRWRSPDVPDGFSEDQRIYILDALEREEAIELRLKEVHICCYFYGVGRCTADGIDWQE